MVSRFLHLNGRNIIVAGLLGSLGDGFCQIFMEDSTSSSDRTFDPTRNLALTLFNASYVGYICNVVYGIYPKLNARIRGDWLLKSKAR
eukprot:1362114-Amorphochlora_amoeboformis.AAC.1